MGISNQFLNGCVNVLSACLVNETLSNTAYTTDNGYQPKP